MPSPSTSSLTTTVSQPSPLLTGWQTIDALLPNSAYKWGGNQGMSSVISYSFAWINGLSAVYTGPDDKAYSTLNEPGATYHYGLDAPQQTSARTALAAWASVANIYFTEVPETTTNVGDIRFAWTSATDTTSSGGKAWGWANYPSSYWPSGGDVWLSSVSTAAKDSDWTAGSYNYFSLMHELGHALGLKHTFEGTYTLPTAQDVHTYSIMSYTDAPHQDWVVVTKTVSGNYSRSYTAIEPSTPMVGDILAIQYLYGANTNYNKGDNVYDFDPTKPFFQTLWDTGGQDTISAARFSQPCTINLNAGSYSSLGFKSNWDQFPNVNWTSTLDPLTIYDGTNNLGIAWGVEIENATGGSGADTLTGNPSNNVLLGGAGNDTMDGGQGNDTLEGDSGNDTLNGNGGTDTACYSGTVKSYSLRIDRAHKTVTIIDTQANRDGQDILLNVEKLQFNNQTFDLFNPARTETPTHSQTNGFLFDASYYLLSHPELAGTVNLQTAFGHYLSNGAAAGYKPNSWFDPVFYANRWSDLRGANLDAATLFQHYNLYGVWEGRSASTVYDQYDGARYLRDNPDVAAYVDGNLATFLGSRTNGAIAHYIIYGADEGRLAYTTTGTQVEPAVIIGAVNS